MGFWTYCEKVSGCVGIELVLANIRLVHFLWKNNNTVGECADRIEAKKM